jgi:hypothetical protein
LLLLRTGQQTRLEETVKIPLLTLAAIAPLGTALVTPTSAEAAQVHVSISIAVPAVVAYPPGAYRPAVIYPPVAYNPVVVYHPRIVYRPVRHFRDRDDFDRDRHRGFDHRRDFDHDRRHDLDHRRGGSVDFGFAPQPAIRSIAVNPRLQH